ncbi:FHA domain-containing protein [Geodermatophilus pulveris]|uniref:FHA domain-containing protein n=1 Tax=Geodermatophilus pulveris TaxID=1564159 RepID=UPI0015C5CC33|nr:FHA domain-containing protein [Geodermatophilus pulveris]
MDDDVLCFRDGDGAARRFVLRGSAGRLLLGRSSRCDLALTWDDEVSRAHAVLERVGEDWLLADDGLSRNGTHVNGERLSGGRRLRHEDRLRLGGTVLTYRRASPAETEATAVGGGTVKISEAQRLVLRALCGPLLEGAVVPATNREIAQRLQLAEDTVKEHLKELFRRFRLDDARPNEKRQRLATRARDLGLM